MQKRLLSSTLTLILILSLSACGHEQNPLTKDSPDVAAKFLYQTARQAFASLHLKGPNDGYDFMACMRHQQQTGVDCQKLYKMMLSIARNKPAYKHLTLKQLTSPEMWETVSEEYARLQFDTIS